MSTSAGERALTKGYLKNCFYIFISLYKFQLCFCFINCKKWALRFSCVIIILFNRICKVQLTPNDSIRQCPFKIHMHVLNLIICWIQVPNVNISPERTSIPEGHNSVDSPMGNLKRAKSSRKTIIDEEEMEVLACTSNLRIFLTTHISAVAFG
jgi:hypothetical protein